MRYKILYIGPSSGTSLHRIGALRRLGHEVEVINTSSLLPNIQPVRFWQYRTGGAFLDILIRRLVLKIVGDRHFDIIFTDSGELLNFSLLRDLKSNAKLLINYNHDDPFGERDLKRWKIYLKSLPCYDLVAIFRDCNESEAISRGAKRVARIDRSADDLEHSPRKLSPAQFQQWESDVCFIGTWMPERGPFLVELIQCGVPLSIWGARWNRSPEWSILKSAWRGGELRRSDDYAMAIQSSKICLGLLSKGNRDEVTTRSFEIPLLGGLFCAERTSEHLKLYNENEEAVFWSSAEECARKCFELLGNDEQRKKIAAAGRLRCITNGTTHEGVLGRLIELASQTVGGASV